MATVRRMETASGNLYKARAVRGFCHLYSGQVSIFRNVFKNNKEYLTRFKISSVNFCRKLLQRE